MSDIFCHTEWRGSFRKYVKLGRKKSSEGRKGGRGGGIISHVTIPHTVFTSPKGGQILARGVNAPKLNEALIYAQTLSYISCDYLLGNKVPDFACTV